MREILLAELKRKREQIFLLNNCDNIIKQNRKAFNSCDLRENVFLFCCFANRHQLLLLSFYILKYILKTKQNMLTKIIAIWQIAQKTHQCVYIRSVFVESSFLLLLSIIWAYFSANQHLRAILFFYVLQQQQQQQNYRRIK